MDRASSRLVTTAHRPLMLASVTSAAEALVCLEAGADIIDAKDPLGGALGALAAETIRDIAARAKAVGRPVSATIGDVECASEVMCQAVRSVAATGVDYVKAGFLPGGEPRAAIAALGRLDLPKARLVGVLFADLDPDFGLIENMAASGFAGVLIDTSDKEKGSLTGFGNLGELSEFIGKARANGLFAGLAGSLGLDDVAPLARLGPDILGFRGALCLDSRRTFAIDEASVKRIRSRLDAVCAPDTRAAG
ncbi:MAG: (5-formylfuran-3-yl)methyl phosphate synthase [Alphaproteobacteria bacterium]|nr:(5-formylfuran-3-yl)methyl phosphate synthase [Alphaproteobacteria bacterium]